MTPELLDLVADFVLTLVQLLDNTDEESIERIVGLIPSLWQHFIGYVACESTTKGFSNSWLRGRCIFPLSPDTSTKPDIVATQATNPRSEYDPEMFTAK
jgi:hypothetical protein